MTKFYISGSTIATLIAKKDNFEALTETVNAAVKMANGRTLVVPKLYGGFLPAVLKASSAEIIADRSQFKKEREAAIEIAKAAREKREANRDAYLARMFGGGHTNKVIPVEELDERRKSRQAYESRRDARRAELAAECQARKGKAGGGGSKGKKAA